MIKRRAVVYKSGVAAAAVGLLLLYYFFDARHLPFPRCPFYLLTHIYCPGCGSQRALSALLHGQVAQALQYNGLLVAAVPLLLYCAFAQGTQSTFKSTSLLYKPVFTWSVLVVVIAFWLLRNIPLYPFTLLAPVR